jgi:hypothetical protein
VDFFPLIGEFCSHSFSVPEFGIQTDLIVRVRKIDRTIDFQRKFFVVPQLNPQSGISEDLELPDPFGKMSMHTKSMTRVRDLNGAHVPIRRALLKKPYFSCIPAKTPGSSNSNQLDTLETRLAGAYLPDNGTPR